ncbi:hypothetical protein LEM8419_03332 [Neolewinella maritima]|uniref:NAD-dependent epimerase/dehydratase domain-containing protein n=1 Tax=Neolewinella maritima TaxID=1383882 RepID=A0ABN8FA25_9BACT|nr:NAD-dependent epimerase/dehydratase family protein [Neolewinella maritima]CAH1002453.1 hypothetical protein LEM8419_03332 [Neolewinella maritima]
MPISPILTGASGMVGRAVLLECLDSPHVERVLMINRQPVALQHPKLTELLHRDFTDIGSIRGLLKGYDACFFCAGVSAAGKSEAEYTQLTYTLVTSFARTLHEVNPDLVFTYVSGSGTDRTETSRMMWARVKGRTENALLELGFRAAYMFRLGVLIPDTAVQSKTGWVNTFLTVLRPLFPLLKRFDWATTSSRIGRAMIQVALHPPEQQILENKDINRLAAQRM